ncbi:MAG: DUF1542 domain-containing protein [Flavisolibacter sp.]
MKKILTLLIAAGAFVAVNAQTSKEEARKVVLGGGKNGDGNTSTRNRDVILGGGNNGSENSRTYPNSYPNSGSRQAQIDQVNREYESKINSIRNNGTLTQDEKQRMIRQLEKDRAKKIKAINSNNSYGKKSKKYHDDDDDDDRYKKKGNNGKHKGWTKGKGNQKKYKDRD